MRECWAAKIEQRPQLWTGHSPVGQLCLIYLITTYNVYDALDKNDDDDDDDDDDKSAPQQ